MTPFGKQLFLAKSEAEAKKLLGITTDTFADEGGNLWVVPTDSKAFITPAEKKFGSRSLSFDSASATLQTATPLTFGGDPFTISCWARLTAVSGYLFRALGTQASFGLRYDNLWPNNSSQPGVDLYGGSNSVAKIWGFTSISATNAYTVSANTWIHFELDYDGAGSLKYYRNGTLKRTWSKTVDREPRRLLFGGLNGFIDEFRILDGICEHTANFTVPTDAYKFSDYPDNTLSLMHFE